MSLEDFSKHDAAYRDGTLILTFFFKRRRNLAGSKQSAKPSVKVDRQRGAAANTSAHGRDYQRAGRVRVPARGRLRAAPRGSAGRLKRAAAVTNNVEER